ncbi:MAG TPA: peptide-binding protein [Candidatus Manganitrophaceae bacterium]|nr:peptide-binding protein [Candidatus Manganitrophaceae bacterium]
MIPLWLCACAQQKEPKNPYTLAEGSIGDAKRLVPMLATDGASADITALIFNGLVKYNKDVQLVGDLAESFEVSPDCMAATFHLRKNVQWHDGAPFTADDVLFTYQKIVDPQVVTPYSSEFETVKEVEKVDPHTVRVRYREPYAPALASWGMGMIPKHLLDGKNLNNDPFNRNPVGTGPFKFSEWVTGQKIVLSANPGYFGGKPEIEQYLYRIIPDTATMFLELKALNLDLMALRPVQYQKQTDDPFFKREFNKFQYPSLGYTYMGYNLLDPKFSDRRVRQALGHAVDRRAILQGVLFGLGKPATGPYIPESWAYNPDVKEMAYDPQRARALLAEAGWKEAGPGGLLQKEGKPFAFTILTNQGNEERAKAAEIIQANLREIGVQAEIRVLEWQALLHEFIDKKRFEAVILGWGVGLDPDLYAIWHSSKTKEGEFNFVSYKNDRVDDLLLQGRKTCDPEGRKKIYREVHRLIADDQPYTFLYYPMALPILHKRFKGVSPSPIGISYNLSEWKIPKNKSNWYTP